MKKIFKMILSGLLTASILTGCGSAAISSTSSSNANAAKNSSAAATSASDTQTAVKEGDGKTLVLYFSGTGTTKKIADMIAKYTGAAEYEVQPADPYTAKDLDYNDKNSRVNKEGADKSLQNVKFASTDVPNWSSYDRVFVGYPIWREDASWVMKSFVPYLDFSGKTVIPFATSSSSDIGRSGQNLAELAGNKGDWQKGKRFAGNASAKEVQDWINSL